MWSISEHSSWIWVHSNYIILGKNPFSMCAAQLQVSSFLDHLLFWRKNWIKIHEKIARELDSWNGLLILFPTFHLFSPFFNLVPIFCLGVCASYIIQLNQWFFLSLAQCSLHSRRNGIQWFYLLKHDDIHFNTKEKGRKKSSSPSNQRTLIFFQHLWWIYAHKNLFIRLMSMKTTQTMFPAKCEFINRFGLANWLCRILSWPHKFVT